MAGHLLDEGTRNRLQGIEDKLLFLSEAVRVANMDGGEGLALILSEIAYELNQMHGKDDEPPARPMMAGSGGNHRGA